MNSLISISASSFGRGRAAVLASAVFAAILMSAAPAEARYTSIVIDADSNAVLQADNPDARNYPASLTKMMTLYLTFEALDRRRLTLDQDITVSQHAANQAPSKLGLSPGETIKVEDAILAVVTKSANDIAVTLAEALGGSEAAFAVLMTQKAHALGMSRTNFHNASGLPDELQRSTPRDMATLGLALVKDWPQYYRYFSRTSFNYNGNSIANHNHLMSRYQGMDGIKTGFINKSGFNLVASAVRNGHRLVGVVFGGASARTRDNYMASLLDAAFRRIADGKEPPVSTRTAAPEAMADADTGADHPSNGTAGDQDDEQDQPHVVKVSATAPSPSHGAASHGHWAVRLGSFKTESKGHSALNLASRHLPSGSHPVAHLHRSGSGSHKSYQAVLIGFKDEKQARRACAMIKHGCSVTQSH